MRIIKFIISGLPFSEPENQFGLLMYLRRTHPDYSHVPIDTVCPAHQNGIYLNPIHPLTDAHKFMTVSTGECGAAQLFDIGSLPGPESEVTLNLSFPCEDSCVRGKNEQSCTVLGLLLHFTYFSFHSQRCSQRKGHRKGPRQRAGGEARNVKSRQLHQVCSCGDEYSGLDKGR